MRYTIREARTHLSRLIREAHAGEDVIVTRRATPIVRIVPLDSLDTENPQTPESDVKVDREIGSSSTSAGVE